MRRFASLALLLTLAGAAPADDERSFMVTSFERLRVDGPFEIEVADGSPGATATGDRAALDRLDIHGDGTTLVIGTVAGGWAQANGAAPAVPHIRLAASGLRTLIVNGGGRVRIAAMRGQRVDIAVNGSGTAEVSLIDAQDLGVTLIGGGAITLAGKAMTARLRSNGAGSIDAGALVAGEANVISESTAGIRLGVRYRVRVSTYSLGGVEILGTPECRVSGPAPVTCPGRVIRLD